MLINWVNINRKFNEGKSSVYYKMLIEEGVSLIERYIKEDNIPKSEQIDSDINKVLSIANMKGLDFKNTKKAMIEIGTILCNIGAISRDGIVIDQRMLMAKKGDVIDGVCDILELVGEESGGKIFKGYYKKLNMGVLVKELDHNNKDLTFIREGINKIIENNSVDGQRVEDILIYNRTAYLIIEDRYGANFNNIKINSDVANSEVFIKDEKEEQSVPSTEINKKKSNTPLIIGGIAIAIIIALVLGSKMVLGSKDNKVSEKDKPTVGEVVKEPSKNNENKDDSNNKIEATNNAVVSQNSVGEVKTVFNEKISFKINDFKIDGSNVSVSVSVESKYDNAINLWPDGIYLMNSNGKRFELDIMKHLQKGENKFDLVSGEKRTFTFLFSNFEDSDNLNLKIDKIWCMDPVISMREKVELRLK